jgi:hypothetical protein
MGRVCFPFQGTWVQDTQHSSQGVTHAGVWGTVAGPQDRTWGWGLSWTLTRCQVGDLLFLSTGQPARHMPTEDISSGLWHQVWAWAGPQLDTSQL